MSIRREGLKPLTAAIVLASAGPLVNAASYEVSFAGYWMDTVTVISNVPGVPTAPMSPRYQLPRLGNYQAPGWPVTMLLSIDAGTGAITDFEYAIIGGGWYGSGGPQALLYSDELILSPTDEYYQQFASGPEFCVVSNSANDADGVLGYDCPEVVNTVRFSKANHTGTICMTNRPSTLAPGANGCATDWGGYPQGFFDPELANGAGQVLPANYSIGGLALSITGSNPPFYRSVDHAQNMRGIEVMEFQGGRGGGTFTIGHSGTLADGDFQVSSLQFEDGSWIQFYLGEQGTGSATLANVFDFSTVVSQQFVLEPGEARAVPAMGLTWFAALFTSITLLAGAMLGGGKRNDHRS